MVAQVPFDDVYEGLRWIAAEGGLISYSDLYGGDRGQAHGRASSELGRISLAEHQSGRPLLSVIAVAQGTSRPSSGLFVLAQDHDSGTTPCSCGTSLIEAGEREPAFLGRQLQLVRAHWAGFAPKLGKPFRPLDESTSTKGIGRLSVDLDSVDRGRSAHKHIQNVLAEFIEAHAWVPRTPEREPYCDMAWEANGTSWIAEVKSLTQTNETQQLRLGLGQVLDYRTRSRTGTMAALVVEREPTDLTWIDVCAGSAVTLCWPGGFDVLLQHGDCTR